MKYGATQDSSEVLNDLSLQHSTSISARLIL